jgi:hypothetical protein
VGESGCAAHYQWLEEDPTYLPRLQEARIEATQKLSDEAVRRPMDGLRKLAGMGWRPAVLRAEHSDHLMNKLREAGDSDHFKRQRMMPLDEGNLDNLTEAGQAR